MIRFTPASAGFTVANARGQQYIGAWASQLEEGIGLIITGRGHESAAIMIPRERIPELEALIEQVKRDDLNTPFREKEITQP
jgi:hypothetical protein